MKITLPGADRQGNHTTQGDKVAFEIVSRGQAAVRMRLAYDIDKPAIVLPLPSGAQPKPRDVPAGRYLVTVRVSAMDLPGLPAKTIDSDLRINGVVVLQARGEIPADADVDTEAAIFRLVVL